MSSWWKFHSRSWYSNTILNSLNQSNISTMWLANRLKVDYQCLVCFCYYYLFFEQSYLMNFLSSFKISGLCDMLCRICFIGEYSWYLHFEENWIDLSNVQRLTKVLLDEHFMDWENPNSLETTGKYESLEKLGLKALCQAEAACRVNFDTYTYSTPNVIMQSHGTWCMEQIHLCVYPPLRNMQILQVIHPAVLSFTRYQKRLY